MTAIRLIPGDCIEVMRQLIAEGVQVDAIVTDPPYHLTSVTKRWGTAKPEREHAAQADGAENPRNRLSRGFMGQTWDGGDIAFRVEAWELAIQLAKPGAHLISFGGTRTYHRMACAIEDAGFEIRDQIGWLYGSGFPKSHDVSKGIDRVGGLPPRQQAALLRTKREAIGWSRADFAHRVGCTEASVRDWEEGRARASGASLEWIVPSQEYRSRVADLLGYSADERSVIGIAVDRRCDGSIIGLGHSGTTYGTATTSSAKEWDGWGTALKPAWEPIVLARKPLIGTVAENVLAHGTGALNIDGCRVASSDDLNGGAYSGEGRRREEYSPTDSAPDAVALSRLNRGIGEFKQPPGRWPANVLHDGSDEVVAAFPDSDGQLAPSSSSSSSRKNQNCYGDMARGSPENVMHPRGDTGSAARFFYSAKADAEDRFGSKHPTVKPIDLMAYLIRLVTPKGGLVLDPFAGSGTTGIAAIHEGCRAILIEREERFVADIRARLDYYAGTAGHSSSVKNRNADPAKIAPDALPLFGGKQ